MSESVPGSSNGRSHIAERCGVALAIACFVARLLVPTESAHLGDTLWLATLLLMAATVYSVGRWQSGHWLRFDWCSVAVGLILIGHVVSGTAIFLDIGNKRSAVNMVWEWASLAVMCYVLRGRRSVLYVLLAMTLVHAGHGLWQYFVDFPAQREEFAAVLDGETTSFAGAQQVLELKARGIPTDPSGLKLFADRLASLEPLGPFALANTLGGFLAVGILLGTALLVGSGRRWWQYALGILCLAVLCYCLFLTKSRTAIVSVVMCWLVLGARRLFIRKKSEMPSKAGPAFALCVVLIVAGAVVAGVASGGLDEQVISESPKSLQYRLMYWQGTIATLQDSLWLGTGPGNFRQNYTAHKLAASSEEILDPHNLFLDAWCNGGVIALCGLLLLVTIVARGVFAGFDEDEPEVSRASGGFLAGLLGFALILVHQFFTGQDEFGLTFALAGGFAVAWLLVRFALGQVPAHVIRCAAAVATCGLVIHLLGAGGFSMPAVAQVLVLGGAATMTTKPKSGVRRVRELLPPMLGATAVIVCLVSATVPVTRAMFLIREGDAAAIPRDALRAYGAADFIDTWSPAAATKFARTQMESGVNAYPALHRARRRDPKDFKLAFALGVAIRRQWLTSPDDLRSDDDLLAAVKQLNDAVSRYPTNPRLLAELAFAHADANQLEATAEVAQRALQLDEINRQNGHRDRYLDAETLTQLKTLAKRKVQEAGSPPEKQSEN